MIEEERPNRDTPTSSRTENILLQLFSPIFSIVYRTASTEYRKAAQAKICKIQTPDTKTKVNRDTRKQQAGASPSETWLRTDKWKAQPKLPRIFHTPPLNKTRGLSRFFIRLRVFSALQGPLVVDRSRPVSELRQTSQIPKRCLPPVGRSLSMST